MSASATAEMGRRLAESLMTSQCRVFRRGANETDLETGEVTSSDAETVFEGPCRVKPANNQADAQDVGGIEVTRFDYIVSIPFAAFGVTTGDRLTVTASPDASLIGIELEVRKPFGGDHVTARRLACAEVL
jgi:hypothetical protein